MGDTKTAAKDGRMVALGICATAAIAEESPKRRLKTEANEYVWASLRWWARLHLFFAFAFDAGFVDEARLITRCASELAINVGWVVHADESKCGGNFTTEDARARALQDWSRNETRKWWDAMQAHEPEKPFSEEMTRAWNTAVAGAKEPNDFPGARRRAVQTIGTLSIQLYDFAYRADSQITHSNTWAVIRGSQGELQLPPLSRLRMPHRLRCSCLALPPTLWRANAS